MAAVTPASTATPPAESQCGGDGEDEAEHEDRAPCCGPMELNDMQASRLDRTLGVVVDGRGGRAGCGSGLWC